MIPSKALLHIARLVASLWLAIPVATALAQSEDAEQPQLTWQAGPLTAPIGSSLAEIEIPEGYVFLAQEDTAKLLELMQNPVSGAELATLAPISDDASWMAFFEWDESGWVDDSEKDALDADALLESVRQGTRHANEERKRRGWATLEIVGWQEAPHYDASTNNLTWAIDATSEGQRVLNRVVKLLGRRGVMTVTIVSDPEELADASAATDALLTGFHFKPGSTYAEYVPGKDQIASYGLAALIAGGAGAAALKSGLIAKVWKYLVVAAVAVAAGIKRLFTGRKHIADPPTPV